MRKNRKILTFDIGGTKVSAALVNEKGKLENYQKQLIPAGCSPIQFKKLLLRVGTEAQGSHSLDAVGVASAGPLESERGILVNPTNLFRNKNSDVKVNLKKPLEDYFQKEVHFENDADAQALGAAWRGDAKGQKNFALVSLGTGVGISIVSGGRVVKDHKGNHPEFSHISLNANDRRAPCGCGANGCIEAYLAGTHFSKHIAKRLRLPELDGESVVAFAKQGHPVVLSEFKNYARNMALALRTLVITFAPQKIIYCGSFSHAFPYFAIQTKKELKAIFKQAAGSYTLPELRLSRKQENLALLGAAYATLNARAHQAKGPGGSIGAFIE